MFKRKRTIKVPTLQILEWLTNPKFNRVININGRNISVFSKDYESKIQEYYFQIWTPKDCDPIAMIYELIKDAITKGHR